MERYLNEYENRVMDDNRLPADFGEGFNIPFPGEMENLRKQLAEARAALSDAIICLKRIKPGECGLEPEFVGEVIDKVEGLLKEE